MDKITGQLTGNIQAERERPVNEEVETHLSESLKMIAEVFSKTDVEVKTDLTERQIVHFSRGKIYADIYDVPLMSMLVDHLAIYSISKNRKSRKEFTEVAKSFNNYGGVDDLEPRGRLDRLFGKGV